MSISQKDVEGTTNSDRIFTATYARQQPRTDWRAIQGRTTVQPQTDAYNTYIYIYAYGT